MERSISADQNQRFPWSQAFIAALYAAMVAVSPGNIREVGKGSGEAIAQCLHVEADSASM